MYDKKNQDIDMLLTAIRYQKEVNDLIVNTLNISTSANLIALLQSILIPQFETLNNLKTEALKRQYIIPEKAEQNKIKYLSNKFMESSTKS